MSAAIDYDKTFSVTQNSGTMTFDSFECAIHAMAPRCYITAIAGSWATASRPKEKCICCAHCAKHDGVKGVNDRAAA